MPRVRGGQEAKRSRIKDLLQAQVPHQQIADIVGVNRSTVIRTKKALEDGKGLERKSRGPPTNKILTDEFLGSLEADYEANNQISIRKMAKAKNVSRQTISNGIKQLGMDSRARPLMPLLNPAQMVKRKDRSGKLVCKLKKLPRGTVKVFSDKKVFTVDQAYNRRNDRVVVKKGAPVPAICKTKHPANVMVLGVVGSDGQKCPLFFFEKGFRMKADDYVRVMRTHVLPWLKRAYPDGNYVFQQDGAPAHTAEKSRRWLKNNLTDFWDKDVWPPFSPDLNPLDYGIWGVMEREACATHHNSLETLKASITEAWDNLSDEFVVKTCRSFRRRLEMVVEADGGYIEKNYGK